MQWENNVEDVLEDQIFQVVEDVWETSVGNTLQRRSPNEIVDTDVYFIIAYITIQGAWEGEIALICDEDLAHHVTAVLFEMDPDEVTDDDIKETISELNNIIGGNLKYLLPEPTDMRLPVVGQEGELRVRISFPEQCCMKRILADCDDRLLLMVLSKRSSEEDLFFSKWMALDS